MQLDKIPYNPSTYEQLNGSIWTIKIEFEAYIALVCLALVGALSRRYLIAVIWVASFGLFIASNEGLLPNRFVHYAAHIEFWNYFATGIAFAAFHSRIPRTGWIALTALLACAAAIASNTLDYALVIAGVYLLFYLGLASGRFSGFGRRIDLSYGTYLFAWPIQVVVSDILPVEASPYVVTLLVLPVVLCVAFASWTLVERPALRLKQPHSRRTEGGPLTVSAAMAIPERH